MSNTSPYQLVEPPGIPPAHDLTNLNPQTLVDYRRHPAYASLVASPRPAARLRALRLFIPSLLRIKVKRAIRYEMIPMHVRNAPGLAGRLRFAGAALANMLRRQRARDLSLTAPNLSPLERSFRGNGCAVVKMPDTDLALLDRLSRSHFQALERRRAETQGQPREFEASRSYASRADSVALFESIERVFADAGILSTASAYLGRRARLIDVNPQINDASDDFWRRIFPDLSLPPPSTAYFHRDASGGDLKAIVYMTEVGPDNGPFGYILGSHRMRLNRTDDHISEANDSNGMAGTGAANRRCFAALPERLRQKGAFGNDMSDDNPVSKTLMRSLWPIVGSRGSIVLFDTKGIHRGGMVIAGERRVITCVIG